MIRLKYSKYPNVVLSDRFSPLIGERYLVAESVKENKYRLWHLMQTALDHPNCNIRIIFSGPKPLYLLYSPQALEEFSKLVPTKIDRFDNHAKHFGKMAKGAIDQMRSTKNWKQRRDSILHTMGIHLASRYIPLMLDTLETTSQQWIVGEWINLSRELTSLTFDVITQILFGRDIRIKIDLIDYQKTDGTYTQYDLMDYFLELIEDLESTSFKTVNRLFPFLEYYKLTTKHKALDRNLSIFWNTLENYLTNNHDEE